MNTKSVRKQERKYFVYDIIETTSYPSKFIRENVGEVFAKDEKSALDKARRIFSSTATVSSKYPSADEYFASRNRSDDDIPDFMYIGD